MVPIKSRAKSHLLRSAHRNILSASWLAEGITLRQEDRTRAIIAAGPVVFCQLCDRAYSLLLTKLNMTPCGSIPCMIQPPPGTGIGPLRTVPPPACTRCIAAPIAPTLK